jgi:ADP-ribose pyrophosphatase
VLSSERPFTGAVVTVRVDEVTMPGGGTARREVAEHARAVAVAAVDSDGDVVLIEQYRHPLRRRLWERPAGLMDVDGELPSVCAARELAEETGLAADRWSGLVDLSTSPGFCTEAVRVFLARDLRTVPAVAAHDEEADLRVVRVPLADAVTAVLDGRIVNAAAVAGVLAAARVLGVGSGGVLGGDRRPGGDGESRADAAPPGTSVAVVSRGDAPGGMTALRRADDPWDGGPAIVNTDGPVDAAPPLGAASNARINFSPRGSTSR